MGDASVERVTPKKYEEGGIVQNYGLYVFNGYPPAELPTAPIFITVVKLRGTPYFAYFLTATSLPIRFSVKAFSKTVLPAV